MDKVLETVHVVYRAHGMHDAVVPAKITLDLARAGSEGWMNAMPAYVVTTNAAGIKFAGGFMHNPQKECLPYIMGTILLIDPNNGVLLAVVGGQHITNVRTGAAPAVAAKFLVPNPKTIGIIGTGAVGRATIQAFDKAFPSLNEIRIYDTSEVARNEALRLLESSTQTRLRITQSAPAAVEGADIIVTATYANSPLFGRNDLKPSALVVPLGSFQELDSDTVLSARCRIVDHLEQNKHRGEFKNYFEKGELADSDIYAEIGEIVAGKKVRPRFEDGICVASLIGVGSLDIALAKEVYDRAIDRGNVGVRIEL